MVYLGVPSKKDVEGNSPLRVNQGRQDQCLRDNRGSGHRMQAAVMERVDFGIN